MGGWFEYELDRVEGMGCCGRAESAMPCQRRLELLLLHQIHLERFKKTGIRPHPSAALESDGLTQGLRICDVGHRPY